MLCIFTIVLDGEPYIEKHLPEFKKLKTPWKWVVVEGAADNNKDTSWCQKQRFRLSEDGTTQYLKSIKDPRVEIVQQERWDNKTAMCNAATSRFRDGGVLMQVDSDEIWKAEQLDVIAGLFESSPEINRMYFYCRYFLGPGIVSVGKDSYGNKPGEWLRAWRFRRGMFFNKHEPPVLENNRGGFMGRETTKNLGLVFDHYAYALEKQVAYKEQFYGYRDAIKHWARLQENQDWPCLLKDFLPWVDDRAIANKIQ